jgi:hypothetical protein
MWPAVTAQNALLAYFDREEQNSSRLICPYWRRMTTCYYATMTNYRVFGRARATSAALVASLIGVGIAHGSEQFGKTDDGAPVYIYFLARQSKCPVFSALTLRRFATAAPVIVVALMRLVKQAAL